MKRNEQTGMVEVRDWPKPRVSNPNFLSGELSRYQVEEKIALLQREADWLTGRLANIVLNEEDFEQTVDSIKDLRDEISGLWRVLNAS